MAGTYDPVRKERYVHNLTLGMEPKAAAAAAGFPSPVQAVRYMKRDDYTNALIESYRQEMAERNRYDRDKAVSMLMDAFGAAKTMDDPKGMVGAVRELNEMHGYHAPVQLDVKTTVEHTSKARRVLAELTDEELIEHGGIVIEGEVQQLEHQDSPTKITRQNGG